MPSDDDWNDPAHSFHWNTPAVGFVTVDRTTDPIDYKAGRFTRRDEFLSHATGMTLAVKVRLLPQSDPDAFFITYVNDYGSVTALLSPDHYKVAGGVNPTSAPAIAADSTGDTRQFWFSQAAGSSTVTVYSDTLAAGVTATLDPAYKVGTDENVAFPYVLVGDNSNEPTSNAAFVLDGVRYRRGGGFAPLSGLTPVVPLRAPPSPLPTPAAEPETFGHVFEGDALLPADPGGVPSAANPTCFDAFCTSGSGSAWTVVNDPDQPDNHYLELDNRAGQQGGTRVENAHGLTNEGDLTMELRFRVFPDSEKRGFGLIHLDESGSFGVSLDPDGIEAFQGVKPFGYQAFAIDLTDRFHVLRLVRKAHELYTQYYLDDHAVPVVVDEHLDASTEHRGFPVHPLVELGYLGVPAVDKHCHLAIDYLRFTDHAWAPPAPAVVQRLESTSPTLLVGLALALTAGCTRAPQRAPTPATLVASAGPRASAGDRAPTRSRVLAALDAGQTAAAASGAAARAGAHARGAGSSCPGGGGARGARRRRCGAAVDHSVRERGAAASRHASRAGRVAKDHRPRRHAPARDPRAREPRRRLRYGAASSRTPSARPSTPRSCPRFCRGAWGRSRSVRCERRTVAGSRSTASASWWSPPPMATCSSSWTSLDGRSASGRTASACGGPSWRATVCTSAPRAPPNEASSPST